MSPTQKKRRHLKTSAKRRGIHFSMTAGDVASVMSSTHCHSCKKRFGRLVELSFDRKDPLKGYTRDNVVAMCVPCNSSKGAGDDQELWDSYKMWLTPHSQLIQMVRVELGRPAVEIDKEWEEP